MGGNSTLANVRKEELREPGAFNEASISGRVPEKEASPVFLHPEVQSQERSIWAKLFPILNDEIERYVAPYSVLEIGGGSGVGARLLRSVWEERQLSLLVVDHRFSIPTGTLSSLGVSGWQDDVTTLDRNVLGGPLDIVVAVRALEYDSQYPKVLQHLRALTHDDSRVVLVHNAETSGVLHRIVRYYDRIEALKTETALLIASTQTRSPFYSVEQTVAQLWSKFDAEGVETQMERFQKEGAWAARVGPEFAMKIWQIKLDQLNESLLKFYGSYGERIESRRFWGASEQEVRESYAKLNLALMHRRTVATEAEPDATVHIDTLGWMK